MMFSGCRVGEVCSGRDNNFNLIRMIAAVAVLVSHSIPITRGSDATYPLHPFIGHSIGWIAVAVFFIVSGFFIARSFDTKSHLIDWGTARVLRIFPALFVVLLLTVLVMGPLVTTLPLREYFLDPGVAAYFLRGISLASIQYTLPGVFESLPHTGEINSSLWTLIHEVLCYMGVVIVGLLGLLRHRKLMTLAFIGYLGFYAFTSWDPIEGVLLQKFLALRGLSLPFAYGMMLYVWRDKVVLNWRISAGLGALAAVFYGTPVFIEVFLLWVSYTVFVLGYLPGGLVRKYNLLGDYSYGFYIYAFPVQQLMVHVFGDMTRWENILLSVPVTLFFAMLSWIWIEKPALSVRHRVAFALQNAGGSRLRKSSLKSSNS